MLRTSSAVVSGSAGPATISVPPSVPCSRRVARLGVARRPRQNPVGECARVGMVDDGLQRDGRPHPHAIDVAFEDIEARFLQINDHFQLRIPLRHRPRATADVDRVGIRLHQRDGILDVLSTFITLYISQHTHLHANDE